jgi:hypothetical protein
MKMLPFTKLALTGYRTAGFAMLLGLCAALLGYMSIMVFFMFSNSWIAPTVLSSTSDKMLQFQSGYMAASQQWGVAEVTHNQAVRQQGVLTAQHAELEDLLLRSDMAMSVETQEEKSQLAIAHGLAEKQDRDIRDSRELKGQLLDLKAETGKLLRSHVVTQDVATQTQTLIQNFLNSMTDDEAARFTLAGGAELLARKRNTLLGAPASVDEMNAVVAYDALKQQLLQNANDLQTAGDMVRTTQEQLTLANQALATLKDTSYMAAMEKGSNLAFVAYDNQQVARVGAPVYDCYLMIIACHQVGTVRHVYGDEQMIDFPVFNIRMIRTIRGFYIDMDITNPKAMGSTVLFINKPLWI